MSSTEAERIMKAAGRVITDPDTLIELAQLLEKAVQKGAA